jgi:hypothetical protein
MLVRLLAGSTAVLLAVTLLQWYRIAQLRAELYEAQVNVVQARSLVADSFAGRGAEFQQAMMWLHDFYRSPEGLQRPQGLWIEDHPDFEGIAVWIFDIYLRLRMKGTSPDDARRAVETSIRQTGEWTSKHRSSSLTVSRPAG